MHSRNPIECGHHTNIYTTLVPPLTNIIMTTYLNWITKALDFLDTNDEDTQMDLIIRMLAHVPAEEHETLIERCAVYCVLSNRTRRMKNASWGDEAIRQEEAKDRRFVEMPVADWENTKMVAKRSAWFPSWAEWKTWADRINLKRRTARPPREVIRREPDPVTQLLEDREDAFKCPQMFVKNEAEAIAFICELENAIIRHGGKARLDKVIDAEWDEAVAAGQVSEEEVVASKELARREAEYAEYPGLANFIQQCGEPCKLVME